MPDQGRAHDHDRLTDGQQAALEENVQAEMVGLSWRNCKTGLYPTPFAIAAFYFGLEGHVSGPLLWGWVAGTSAVAIGRLAMVVAWTVGKPDKSQCVRWGWYYFTLMLIVSGFWGIAPTIFLSQLDPLRQAFVFIMVIGLAGASVASFTSHRPSMLFAPPVMLMPLVLGCVMIGGETMLLLAGMGVVFCAYLIRTGLNHHQTQKEALRLRYERSALVDSLRAARDTAEEANRVKSEFLANMSHELRTPLNAILGFSEMMQLSIFQKSVPDRFREYAALIHHSGQHLLELISDLLDISKAEAGALELQEEEVDLAEHVATSIELLAAVARKSNVTLTGPADPGETIRLRADGRKLRQIHFNLISNSIKFTPAGGEVKVSVGKPPEGGIEITVSDTGIGMTQEQIEMALKPFVQIDQGYSKRYAGTGLGLPLARTLTELHGGRFAVESALGEGTTVRVQFPAERLLSARRRKSA